jgi:hypothetical protein
MLKSSFDMTASVLDEVRMEVRVAHTEEARARAMAALNAEHSQGAGRTAGESLWQLVYEGEVLCAVVVWCACAFRLKARDAWIGWDDVTRARRLKLIVQNRRFLVLQAARRPNLASQCMGAALRALPAQWQRQHGYAPLLAESFTDPEAHAGTTYKVTNWEPLGHTAGFSQKRPQAHEHKLEFYVRNERPKRLWVKELARGARQRLCARELGEAHSAGQTQGAGGRSPLKAPQLRSLREAFREVPDPRHPKSRRHPFSAMLCLIALGLLQGARNTKDIWRKVARLDQKQREAIGLSVREKTPARRLKMPGYDALNDLLGAVNPRHMAAALSAWLGERNGSLPRSLAIDGKDINEVLGCIITLCEQRDGAPAAMTTASGRKADSELTVAQDLLEDPAVNLTNTVVTADALHTQHKTAQIIIERGGDYVLPLKGNQPGIAAAAAKLLEAAPFLARRKSPPRMDASRSAP